MDATFSLARLMQDFNALLESEDFEGAEEVMNLALHQTDRYHMFFHFQFGRLYGRWNKLSSAINHLNLAVELGAAAADEILMVQVIEELRRTKEKQLAQTP